MSIKKTKNIGINSIPVLVIAYLLINILNSCRISPEINIQYILTNNVEYTFIGDAWQVSGCSNSYSGDIAILSNLNGLPVARIGNYSFSFGSLTGIMIPGSVVLIGKGAFYNCSGLTNATILNGTEFIGSRAFMNCTDLKVISLPGSIDSLGDFAFSGCSGLTNFVINASVPPYFGYNIFSNDGMITITVPSGEYAAYTNAGWIPSNLGDSNITITD
jgi:hypothetical protein